MPAVAPDDRASATALLEAFRLGRLRPSEVIDATLACLDACEPAVHAFRTRCDDHARGAAADSDARWRRGGARALEGVPFAVKDNIETKGVLTTAGSRLFSDWVPDGNATAVQRLLDAGAILVGKTATPEFAFGDAIDGHQPVNPWHPDHWTGGSSSGSAVALAAGEVPVALGTDTGGSIRVPASYCGVAGLKPTFGLVPRDGVVPVAPTLDHCGPMARTVDDLALMLGVMADRAGPAPLEVGSRPLRIGRPVEWFYDWGTPEVLHATDDAIGTLVARGATVHDLPLPGASRAGVTAWTLTVAEFADLHHADHDRHDAMTPTSVRRIRAGSELSANDRRDAIAVRAELQHDVITAFTTVDVIVTPATPTTAPRITPPVDSLFEGGDSAWLDRIARNFLIANVTGIPALVVPVGLHDGLPVAVQILGPAHGDGRCLEVGRAIAAALDPGQTD